MEASSMATLQSQALRFADGYVISVAHACRRRSRGAPGPGRHPGGGPQVEARPGHRGLRERHRGEPRLEHAGRRRSGRGFPDGGRGREAREEFGAAVDAAHRRPTGSSRRARGPSRARFSRPGSGEQLEGLIAAVARAESPRAQRRGDSLSRIRPDDGERASPLGKLGTGSIFTLLHIDPFAGLDPTTVAIEQSRELAARTVAYLERAPTLMRWQAELLAFQLAAQPDPQKVLADVGPGLAIHGEHREDRRGPAGARGRAAQGGHRAAARGRRRGAGGDPEGAGCPRGHDPEPARPDAPDAGGRHGDVDLARRDR